MCVSVYVMDIDTVPYMCVSSQGNGIASVLVVTRARVGRSRYRSSTAG